MVEMYQKGFSNEQNNRRTEQKNVTFDRKSVGDGCSTEVEQTPHYPLVVGSITAACVFYLFISISWVSLKQAPCILKKITS